MLIPIISTDFLRHFGLGVDVVNNFFICHITLCIVDTTRRIQQYVTTATFSNITICRIQQYVNRDSCASASGAIESPPSSTSSTDVTNKFLLEACAAHNWVRNVDAANAIAYSIHDLPRNFVDPPNVHDAAVLSFLQGPKDPPAKSNSKPRRSLHSSFSNAFNVNVPKHNALEEREVFLLTVPLLNSR